MAKILITGGAGFIGSHTADALLAQGHQVRVLDLLDPQIHGEDPTFPSHLHPDVETIRGDVRDPDTVGEALRDVDGVYHFAAQTGVGQSMYDIRAYVDTNCTGTANLIEAIVKRGRPITRLVLASSRAVYGEGTYTCPAHGRIFPAVRGKRELEQGRFGMTCPHCGTHAVAVATAEERPLNPISVYGWTKKHQEDLCRYAADTYGLPAVCLRYFNVYGSRQSLMNPYTGVVTVFYNRIRGGKPISLYERGAPLRDFVHVRDVARANVLALQADIPAGACINVGSGARDSILDIARSLAGACGREAILEDHGEFRVGDIYACYADLEKARHLLGYRPEISLDAGMREFVAWADGQRATDLYEQTVSELKRYGLFGSAGKA